MSPVRLTQLIVAIGVLSLTACAADGATAPITTRAAGVSARDVEPCGGYSVADGRCESVPAPVQAPAPEPTPTL